MSKLANALKKAGEERANIVSPVTERKILLNNNMMEGKMKKTWIIWGGIAVIVTAFIALNYQGGKDAVPLSEIFPEEEVFPVEVEYEFVQEEVATQAAEVETSVAEAIPTVTSVAATPVKEAVVKETVKRATPVDTIATVGKNAFTIQIASFKDRKRAEEALAAIRTKVPTAYIASRDLGAKGVWYRVYAGQFQRRSEAEVTLSNIKKNYNDSFIISPKKAK